MEPQHEYKNVSAVDNHDDDSSTEVESLVGMEKQWASETFTRRRRSKRNACVRILKASRWFVVIGLQLILVGLLAKDQGMLRQIGLRSGRSSAMDVGGDVTGWGPHSMCTTSVLCYGADEKQSLPKLPSSRSIKLMRQ